PGKPQPSDGPRQHRVCRLVTGRRNTAQPFSCDTDSVANRRGSLPRPAGELDRARSRHRDDEVEPVEERARQLVAVPREPLRRARALEIRIAARTARADVRTYFGPVLRPTRSPRWR